MWRQDVSLLEWGRRLESPWCGQKGVRREEQLYQVINRSRSRLCSVLNAEISGSHFISWTAESLKVIQRWGMMKAKFQKVLCGKSLWVAFN